MRTLLKNNLLPGRGPQASPHTDRARHQHVQSNEFISHGDLTANRCLPTAPAAGDTPGTPRAWPEPTRPQNSPPGGIPLSSSSTQSFTSIAQITGDSLGMEPLGGLPDLHVGQGGGAPGAEAPKAVSFASQAARGAGCEQKDCHSVRLRTPLAPRGEELRQILQLGHVPSM